MTLYQPVTAERRDASFGAPPLVPMRFYAPSKEPQL
jgi:hypothetical protein